MVQLQISGTGLADTDGSEQVLAAKLENVPTDYQVFVGANAGSNSLAQNVGGGTWAIPLTATGQLPAYIAVKAPENVSGTTNVTLTVYSGEAGLSPKADTATFDLTFNAVADGLTINPTQTFGRVGGEIPIHLNATVRDTDGSETVTVKLTGLGENVTFNKGTAIYDNVSDTYTVSGIAYDQVPDLSFTTRSALSGTVNVEAWTVETSNNDASAAVNGSFQVDVRAGAGTGRSAFFSAFALDTLNTAETESVLDADGNPIASEAVLSLAPEGEALAAEDPAFAEAEAAIDEAFALLPLGSEASEGLDIPDFPDADSTEDALSASAPEAPAALTEEAPAMPELPAEAIESAGHATPEGETLDLGAVSELTAESETPDLSAADLGLTAEDVLDLGGGELPLPGTGEAAPEAAGEAMPEFYAPPVPDAAVAIAQEMENAIQP